MVACISSERSPRESSPVPSKKGSSKSSKSHKENNDGNSEEKVRDYQTFAQKLNNNAAMCIEIGYYDKATQSLQRALNFYQKQSDESMIEICPCGKCESDGNIDFSADFRGKAPRRISLSSHCSDEGDDDEYIKKPSRSISKEDIKFLTKSISNPKLEKLLADERRRLRGESADKNANWCIEDEFCEGEFDENDEDLIYKRPIRVERVGHPMGASLFLVITFNLALTHHLEVAMPRSTKRHDSKSAKKALLFYELASAHESRLLADSCNRWDSLNSIRFNKILTSNLTQMLQYLPDASLPAAHGLVSTVSRSIVKETDRLSGGSASENKKNRRRISNDPENSFGDKPRMNRANSENKSQSTRIGRSRMKPRKTKSISERSNSGSSRTRSLQDALGDMAPSSCKNLGA